MKYIPLKINWMITRLVARLKTTLMTDAEKIETFS
jgi:hypothetical protein